MAWIVTKKKDPVTKVTHDTEQDAPMGSARHHGLKHQPGQDGNADHAAADDTQIAGESKKAVSDNG